MEFGANKQERSLKIQPLLTKGSNETYILKVDVKDTEKFFVHSVPVGFPKYRISNTRTKFDQLVYIKNNGKDTDFFNDHERLDVQEVQHSILKGVYRKKGLYDEFKSKVKQIDPLIMTIDGFIISGNRRLAVFRELVEKDSQNYDYLKTVKIVVFPHEVDSDKVKKLEAIQETDISTKLNFDWINVAMEFSERMAAYEDPDHGYNAVLSDYVKSKYIEGTRRSKQVSEIDMWIDASEHALRLLSSDEMDEVEIINQVQVFKDWAKNSRLLKGSHIKKQIYNRVAETIIKSDSSEIGDRKYTYINKFYKHFDRWFNSEVEEKKLITKTPLEREVKIETDLKEKPEKKIVDDIIAKVDLFSAQENFKKSANAVLKLLADVSSKLSMTTSVITDFTIWDGVGDHINAIEKLLKGIKQEHKKNTN